MLVSLGLDPQQHTVLLPDEGVDQALGHRIVAEGETPDAQPVPVIHQFQHAGTGMIGKLQDQPAPEWP